MNKILLTTIAVLSLLGLAAGGIAQAGDTVTATVTLGTISVTVSPTSFDYGSMPLSGTKESFDTTGALHSANIQATVGTVATDLDIKGADTGTWALGATPGSEIYEHGFGKAADGVTRPSSYAALTTSYATFDHTPVAASGSDYFGLKIYTPTASAASTQQSAAVQLRATWHG